MAYIREYPSGFSIYQISWIKSNFLWIEKRRFNSGNSVYNLDKHLGDFVKRILTILLQFEHENNFLPSSKHRQAGGGGVLPYMGFIGMCRCEGYGFQVVYCGIG